MGQHASRMRVNKKNGRDKSRPTIEAGFARDHLFKPKFQIKTVKNLA